MLKLIEEKIEEYIGEIKYPEKDEIKFIESILYQRFDVVESEKYYLAIARMLKRKIPFLKEKEQVEKIFEGMTISIQSSLKLDAIIKKVSNLTNEELEEQLELEDSKEVLVILNLRKYNEECFNTWKNCFYIDIKGNKKFWFISNDFHDVIVNLKLYFNFLKEEEEQEIKKQNRHQVELLKLLNQLENVQEDQYWNIRISHRLPAIEFYTLSKMIFEHNQEIFEAEKNNQQTKVDVINQLLENYNIKNHLTEEEIETILKNKSIEEVESILQVLGTILSSISITNEQIVKILLKTTKEKVAVINTSLLCNFISYSFVIENLEIFYSKQNAILEKNINYLLENKIKIKDGNHLLLEAKLQDYLLLAQSYDLPVSDENVLRNMMGSNFFTYLEMLYSLGLKEDIKKKTEILNEDLEKLIIKFLILEALQINFRNEEGEIDFKKVIGGSDLGIPEENLKEYLFLLEPEWYSRLEKIKEGETELVKCVKFY